MNAGAISEQPRSFLGEDAAAAPAQARARVLPDGLPQALPQVSEALSTWRFIVRQIPRSIAWMAALGALATAALGIVTQSQILMAAGIAWELTACLALWLEARWRSNQDLESHIDQIANNALQEGGRVFEELREQRDELSSELRSVHEANARLEQAVDALGNERSEFENTLRLAEADLSRAEETERIRASQIDSHQALMQNLQAVIDQTRSQIAHEEHWQRLATGLNQVADRYLEMIQREAQGADHVVQLAALLDQVQSVRRQMHEREIQNPADREVHRALEQTTGLLHEMAGRLRRAEEEGIQRAQALEAERTRIQELDLQMSVCRQRLAHLTREVEALAPLSARSRSRDPSVFSSTR